MSWLATQSFLANFAANQHIRQAWPIFQLFLFWNYSRPRAGVGKVENYPKKSGKNVKIRRKSSVINWKSCKYWTAWSRQHCLLFRLNRCAILTLCNTHKNEIGQKCQILIRFSRVLCAMCRLGRTTSTCWHWIQTCARVCGWVGPTQQSESSRSN